jgi:hypothetical protein
MAAVISKQAAPAADPIMLRFRRSSPPKTRDAANRFSPES